MLAAYAASADKLTAPPTPLTEFTPPFAALATLWLDMSVMPKPATVVGLFFRVFHEGAALKGIF